VRLFEEVVLDVWKDRQASATKITLALRRKIDDIAERKNRLTQVYVYERGLDKETYQDQLSRLREESLLAEMELNEAKVEELDVEAVVNYGVNAISDASQFWRDGSVDQKQRFQRILFPEGLTFDGENFGTAATCLAFSYLREVSQCNVSLASQSIPSWNQIIAWLREMDQRPLSLSKQPARPFMGQPQEGDFAFPR